jgi:hypothetical protein
MTDSPQPLLRNPPVQFSLSVSVLSFALPASARGVFVSRTDSQRGIDGTAFDETHREPSMRMRTEFACCERPVVFHCRTLRADALTGSGITRQEGETIRLKRFCDVRTWPANSCRTAQSSQFARHG